MVAKDRQMPSISSSLGMIFGLQDEIKKEKVEVEKEEDKIEIEEGKKEEDEIEEEENEQFQDELWKNV